MVLSLARKASACALASLLLSATTVSFAEQSVSPLELQDAIVRSLERNPELKAFAYEVEAQFGRVHQAGGRATPEVSLLVENAFGTDRRSGFDSAETTLSLDFLIEHGARQRRLDAVQAGSQLLDSETVARRLDVAAETTRRYLAILTAQEALKELNRAVALAQETLTAVQVRVRAARAPQAEEARAFAEGARLKLEHEHLKHELATARQRLAALWARRKRILIPCKASC